MTIRYASGADDRALHETTRPFAPEHDWLGCAPVEDTAGPHPKYRHDADDEVEHIAYLALLDDGSRIMVGDRSDRFEDAATEFAVRCARVRRAIHAPTPF